MADPVRKTDIPAYDTYPAPSEAAELRMRAAVEIEPERELPQARGNPQLNDAAERIGTVVGKTVAAVRDIPERLQDVKQRFQVIRGRTRRQAREQADELAETAKQQVRQARTRADQLVHQNPIATILVAGGIGLVLGIVLRIWRSSRG